MIQASIVTVNYELYNHTQYQAISQLTKQNTKVSDLMKYIMKSIFTTQVNMPNEIYLDPEYKKLATQQQQLKNGDHIYIKVDELMYSQWIKPLNNNNFSKQKQLQGTADTKNEELLDQNDQIEQYAEIQGVKDMKDHKKQQKQINQQKPVLIYNQQKIKEQSNRQQIKQQIIENKFSEKQINPLEKSISQPQQKEKTSIVHYNRQQQLNNNSIDQSHQLLNQEKYKNLQNNNQKLNLKNQNISKKQPINNQPPHSSIAKVQQVKQDSCCNLI